MTDAAAPRRPETTGSFRNAVTVARLRGVPVRIDWSWLVIAGLVAWIFYTRMGLRLDDTSAPIVAAAALVATILFFGSLLAHEVGHAPFTINVTNVNEAPTAIADDDDAANSVKEGAANGTVVGVTALASDPDAGTIITYSLTDDAGGIFTIDSSTGIVTVKDGSKLDFDLDPSHTITVQATDSGGLSTTQSFTIGVEDVKDPVSEFDLATLDDLAAHGVVRLPEHPYFFRAP